MAETAPQSTVHTQIELDESGESKKITNKKLSLPNIQILIKQLWHKQKVFLIVSILSATTLDQLNWYNCEIFGLFRTFPIFPTQNYDLWVNLKFNGNNFLGSVASRRRFRGPGCHRSLKDLDVRDMTPKIGVEIRSTSTQLFA